MTREQALAGRARPHILTSRLFSVKAPSMKLLSWQAMTSTRDKRRPQGLLIYSCADEDLGAGPRQNDPPKLAHCEWIGFVVGGNKASLAQLVEHALRKCTVMGSGPIGGFCIRLFAPLSRLERPQARTYRLEADACYLLPAQPHTASYQPRAHDRTLTERMLYQLS